MCANGCVHVRVCMCVCLRTCVGACVPVHTHAVCVYVYPHVRESVCVCVCVSVCARAYTSVSTYLRWRVGRVFDSSCTSTPSCSKRAKATHGRHEPKVK